MEALWLYTAKSLLPQLTLRKGRQNGLSVSDPKTTRLASGSSKHRTQNFSIDTLLDHLQPKKDWRNTWGDMYNVSAAAILH